MIGLEPSLAALSWPEVVHAGVTILAGYTVLGLSGFGSALVIVPLLSWHWPLALVVPLTLLIDVPASLLHTGLNLRRVAWGEVPRLVLPMVAGSLFGIWLLAGVPVAWPLLLLGLYISAVGVRGLRPPIAMKPVAPGWAWPAGLAIGLVESMFGTAGPVVVAWLSRRLPDPMALRASLPITIVIAAAFAIAGAVVDGRLQSSFVWGAWLGLLPIGLAGVFLGHRIAMRLPPERTRPIVFGLLVISGLSMVVRSLLALMSRTA